MTAFYAGTLATLSACKSAADFYRVQIDIQEHATPAEVELLMRSPITAPAGFHLWLQGIWSMMTGEGQHVQPYRLNRISQNVLHYSGPSPARTLVVGFCGKVGLLFMPIPVVLQHFVADECDVLVLRDPSRSGFVTGIHEHSESLPQMIDRLRGELDLDAYEEIRTFGTSGGGAPALAGGVLLKAKRAVCFSGHLPSASRRYGTSAGAAEVERALRGAAPLPDYACVFGTENARDATRGRQLQEALGLRTFPIAGVSHHNVIYEIHKKRELLAFFRQLGLT